MANKVGRPSDYRPEYVEQVIAYLKTCSGSNQKLPKRVDLALMFDCDENTLAKWGEDNPEFLSTLTRVDAMQKGQLMDDGFYGGKEVNSRMGQFLLSANHGMAESTKQDITSAGEKLEAPHITLDVTPNNSPDRT